MRQINCNQWIIMEHAGERLPVKMEEQLLLEAYRELPRSYQTDTLGQMLYTLDVVLKEKRARWLTTVKIKE